MLSLKFVKNLKKAVRENREAQQKKKEQEEQELLFQKQKTLANPKVGLSTQLSHDTLT